jgi:hypothetical protein
MDKLIRKHRREFASALRDKQYDVTDGGILFPKQQVFASGMYFHSVNGQDERCDPNLLPDASILNILNVVFGATAKQSTWYLSMYANAVSPAANWTQANYAATAGEITSLTEGYTQATRPTWTPGVAAAGQIDNLSARSTFTIACTTSLTVNGAALHSDNTRGGTTGVLGSAARFGQARTLYNDDSFQLGYRVTLAS